MPPVAPVIEVRYLVLDDGGRRRLFRKKAGMRARHGLTLSVKPRELVTPFGKALRTVPGLGRRKKAERVMVMREGRIVEPRNRDTISDHPAHP